MKIKFSFFCGMALTCMSAHAFASSMDNYLHQRLQFFNVTPYVLPTMNLGDDYQAKVELGRRLFIDTNVSGNRNINCLTCHNPKKGTSDGLPLSRTEDGKGVLKRNSPGLYNIGDKFNQFMFADGRVHYSPSKKVFTTPEESLNGLTPKASHITSVMKSALAAQALFPLVSHEEMSGKKGDNEIANAPDNLQAWDLIIKRLTSERDSKTYIALFNRAFPEVTGDVQKINIGHAGEAMATFMREQFQSNTSPFHRFVAGDDSAMGVREKRGLLVFMEQGRCITCHQGSLLGNSAFFASVGVPSFGAKPFTADRGRGEVNNETFRSFFFKTPSLVNVALSAPYMHNGAFKTIREVLNHYNNIDKSLNTFDLSQRRHEFPVEMEVLNSPSAINAIWESIEAGFLRGGLGLSPEDLDDLEAFLTMGLTDPKWDTGRVGL